MRRNYMKSEYRWFTVSKRFLALTLVGYLMIACNSSNQRSVVVPPVVGDTPQPTVAERLQKVLDQAVADGLPGTALAVKSDDLNFTGVAGVENIETAVPLTVNHRFYLASVGKTYTAVAMVRLAADGLLNLDDPITTWLPAAITDRIPSSDAITIRSLLNHTSGIFDFRNDGEDWLDEFQSGDPARHWTNADILPYFFDKPLHFESTTDYRYSNSNYVLAALIAEAASGQSIQELIRNYILAPLGLQETVHGHEALGIPSIAHGYVDADGDTIDVYPWYSHYGVSDGGVQSSAAGLAVFVHHVLTGDTVLSDAMRTELVTPPNVGNPPSTYGLGIARASGETPEVIDYWNSGKNLGARADFHHITSVDGSVTIAFCASASFGKYDILYDQFMQAVIEVLIDAEALPGARP